MTRKVHVVDYGIGNLLSVARAFEKVGAEPRLTNDAREIATADRIVLPGVGAFRNGMSGLRNASLEEALFRFAQTERPLLGICLGMQMLASQSSEYGEHAGLGILPGSVNAIPTQAPDGMRYKVPFIGWADLEPVRSGGFAKSLLDGIQEGDAVYLVHSYQFTPVNPSDILATYRYGNQKITAAVSRDNITGFQFHPEKSGVVGLRLLNRFAFS